MAGLNEVLGAPDWQQKIGYLLSSFVEPIPGAPVDIPLYIAFDQQPVVQHQLDRRQAEAWQQQRDLATSIHLARTGDLYVRDHNSLWGFAIVAGPTNAEVTLLCRTAFAPPQDLIMMTYEFLKSLATLWQKQPMAVN
ncbi:MAG: hypothetical protein R2932_29660 [Caldilineaceae bacterium]